MKRELQLQLFEKYPLIFKDRVKPMTETSMCWGIETGDGWFTLLDVLCGYLQWETDNNDAPQVVASQVKEKYGELRFYVGATSKRQDAMIDFAESLSARTCEVCGAPAADAKAGASNWITTRCGLHE